MSASEHSSQASSSRLSKAGKRRGNVTATSIFPMIKAVSCQYHPHVVLAGVVIEALQVLSLALNPHVGGHTSTWKILYIVQLPYWDGTYATGLTYSGFLAFYWVVTIWAWLMFAMLLVGIEHAHFVSTTFIKPFLRHVVNLYTSVLFIPVIQTLLTTLSCTPLDDLTHTNQAPNTIWLFPDQNCETPLAMAHRGVSIALAIIFVVMALAVASCNFPTGRGNTTLGARAHPYVDLASLVFKLGACVMYQLLLPRGYISYYSFLFALAAFVVATLHGAVLPFASRTMNSFLCCTFSLAGWASLVVFMNDRAHTPAFVYQGGFFAVLLLGGVAVTMLAYWLSQLRYSAHTAYLLKMSVVPGFVPPEENPFAKAAQEVNPEKLPFPAGLPLSDFVFSPLRFVEADVIEEALRAEDAQDFSERDAEGQVSTTNRMTKYINRVQVVSPTIDRAWLATDAEVSTRFLADWIAVTNSEPTPHMLSFACRIYARFLLKFPSSPTATVSYVRFLTDYAPSLSRMNLSVKILEALPNDMFCDMFHLYQVYLLTLSVKEVLGVRDKTHERVYRRCRRLHKETLIQTAAVWRRLLDEERNVVNLCYLNDTLSDIRNECMQTYLQAMQAASDDETLYRSFATFVEQVTQDRACATQCLDEAENISRRRRAKLMQRTESTAAATEAENATSTLGSTITRLNKAADDGTLALRRIVELVRMQAEGLSQNLSSRSIFNASLLISLALCGVLGAFAAVIFSQFTQWTAESDRTFFAGELRSRAQQAVAQLYRVAEALPLTNVSSYSAKTLATEVDQLSAYTYALESSANYMTVGPGKQTDPAMIRFVTSNHYFVKEFSTAVDYKVVQQDYWNLLHSLVHSLLQCVSVALKAPAQPDFFYDTNVLRVIANIRVTSLLLNDACDEQQLAQKSLADSFSVAFAVTMFVFALLVVMAAYAFVWTFRRSASSKVQVLSLFLLIPQDTVKRIAADAKSKVEKFLSGEQLEKEEPGGDLAGVMPDGSSRGSSGDNPKSALDFDDDDLRRSSYSSKLLAHLFQKSSDFLEDDDSAPNAVISSVNLLGAPASTEGANPAKITTEELLQQVKEGDSSQPDQQQASDMVGSRKQSIGASKVGFLDTQKGPESKPSELKAEPSKAERRRPSVSLGNAIKNVDPRKHRTSVLEMVADNAAPSEDGENPMDQLEHDLHAAHSSPTAADEDEMDRQSFSRKSGLTVIPVLLLLAITATVVVGIAFTAQILVEDVKTTTLDEKMWTELMCTNNIRASVISAMTTTQRFVASGSFDDYVKLTVAYDEVEATMANCNGAVPSTLSMDGDWYALLLHQVVQQIKISASLLAVDFTVQQQGILGGCTWRAPPRTYALVKLLEPLVTGIEHVWFPYSDSATDLALSVTQRRALANSVLYGPVGAALYGAFLRWHSALEDEVAHNHAAARTDVHRVIQQDVSVGMAMWGLTALLSFTFVTQWPGSRAVRRSITLLCVASVVCVLVGIGVVMTNNDRKGFQVALTGQEAARGTLLESLSKMVYDGYRAIFDLSPIALYDYLAATTPSSLTANQDSILVAEPFATDVPSAMDNLKRFVDIRSDVHRNLIIALRLSVSSFAEPALFLSDPRLSDVSWNRTADPSDYSWTLRYPQDDANMYSNSAADLARPVAQQAALAVRVMSMTRTSSMTYTLFQAATTATDTLAAYQREHVHDKDGQFQAAASAFLAVAALACVLYGIAIVSVSLASINSFSETQLEADMYEALYATHSLSIGLGFVVVAVCILAVGIMGIAFSHTEVTDQGVLFAATQRTSLVAEAMSHAQAAYAASTQNDRFLAISALRAVLASAVHSAQRSYFGTASAFDLRAQQNAQLFGPQDSLSVRDVRSSLLTTSTDTCFNPANAFNGNQLSVAILFEQFMQNMRRIAHMDEYDLANSGSTPAALASYINAAGGQYDTLMYVLSSSDTSFLSAMRSAIQTRITAMIAVLVVALGLVLLVLVTAVLPVIRKMSLHEAGTKLLLTLLPEDVRNTCPEIADFFDADAGTKDDQLKKKILQSEKLLQNILPPVISRRLKNGERVIADTHPNVTVVFAALIGFDEYSAKMEAKQIVHFLNSLIVTFDQITDLLELEKIKTIGDIYFLCGGLTKKTESDHPLRCMECALLFLEAVGESNVRHSTPNLTLRIGINTDPAVAGVIGSKKVAYDLWGDSVNTASRMQSTGLPGKIQVSDKTFHLIKEYYAFTDRKVAAKGKGELSTHVFTNRTKPTPYRNLNWRISTR